MLSSGVYPQRRSLSFYFKFLLTNRLNQDCLDHFFSVIRSRGGHRDNPNSVEFRADYRAVAIDSLFVKSQNTNCIEDRHRLIFTQTRTFCIFHTFTLPDTNTALPLISQDLAAVSNMPPNVTPQGGNIIVYLAGYVGRKAVLKFKCKDCRALWKKHDESSHSDLYTFINNKQYDDLPKYCIGGLHNLPGIRVQGASSPCHPQAKNRPSFHVAGEGCLQHFQHNMFEHCVHIGAILYGAIVLYCQDSPSSSGTKQANTAP